MFRNADFRYQIGLQNSMGTCRVTYLGQTSKAYLIKINLNKNVMGRNLIKISSKGCRATQNKISDVVYAELL